MINTGQGRLITQLAAEPFSTKVKLWFLIPDFYRPGLEICVLSVTVATQHVRRVSSETPPPILLPMLHTDYLPWNLGRHQQCALWPGAPTP